MQTQRLAKNVPFNFVNGSLTLFVAGKAYVIGKNDQRMCEIKNTLSDETKTEDDLFKILQSTSIENYVNSVSESKVHVKDGEVYFGDERVNTVLSTRIKECMKFGLPFEHMLKFMENLYNNPSATSVSESFDFLANESLPITDDGCFLAYKAVRHDWYDKYKGVIFNGIGEKPELLRNQVDDCRERACSFGLHVGALPYVQRYGNGYDDRIIYVKVNPADIVSVPTDHNAQKIRVCKYEVIGEYKGELNQSPVYGSDLNSLGKAPSDDWDDDWDDDDYENEDDYKPSFYDDYQEDEDLDYYQEDEDLDEDLEDDYDDKDLLDKYSYEDNSLPKSNSSVDVAAVDEYYKGFGKYGKKPSGQKFYNVRNCAGKFTKLNRDSV